MRPGLAPAFLSPLLSKVELSELQNFCQTVRTSKVRLKLASCLVFKTHFQTISTCPKAQRVQIEQAPILWVSFLRAN